MSTGRVEIEPVVATLNGLRVENARSIPSTFKAGDMSDAIYCYRAVRPDHGLTLKVQRHRTAEVDPAEVAGVNIMSVITGERDDMLTRVEMQVDVGNNFRFLQVTLPEKDDTLWTAFVNGNVVDPTREGQTYRIPLERAAAADDEQTSVELVYASKIASTVMGKQLFRAPSFNLPLNNVTWVFRVPKSMRCYGFDGELRFVPENSRPTDVQIFSATIYDAVLDRLQQEDATIAAKGLNQGDEYYRQKGRPRDAIKAFEQAMMRAQKKGDLEDAKIKLENVVKQSAKVGLVEQRRQMWRERNASNAPGKAQTKGYNLGNFTADYARQVERSLDAKESEALGNWVQKVIDQQAAAAGISQGIRVVVPEHGRRLQFFRPMVTRSGAPMMVEFAMVDLRPANKLWETICAAVALLLILRLAVGRIVKPAIA